MSTTPVVIASALGRLHARGSLTSGLVAVEVEPTQLHRFSLEEYHRLIESGGFDEDSRVELLDGLLVSMTPKSPAHENAVAWLQYWLIEALDRDSYQVRVGSPLTLERSEPEPDLTVIRRDVERPYHPATAALVVEVSVSSLQRDLSVKPRLYAAAQVDEYWVVDLDGGRVVAHRSPQPDGYRQIVEAKAGDRLEVTGLRLPPLDVAALLGATDA
jgi:Uma2 family endonuclease